MSKNKKIVYPVTKDTMHKYVKSIFDPIRRGESVTTVWVPMAGRRVWNKFLISNIHLFEKELPNYDKYVLVYVEPLDLTEESLTGYLRLMGKSFIEVCQMMDACEEVVGKSDMSIFEDENVTYSKLLEALKNLIHKVVENGLEVVFFLGEFDELGFAGKIFYNNLKGLWNRLYPGLHYVFVTREKVVRPEAVAGYGDFNEVVLQNIIYIPLLGEKDFEYVAKRLSGIQDRSITDHEIKLLNDFCGGHPYMLKVCLRLLANRGIDEATKDSLSDAFFDYYELKSVARGVLEVFDSRERDILNKIINGQKVSGKDLGLDALLKLRVIKKDAKEKYKVSGNLLGHILKRTKPKLERVKTTGNHIQLDSESGAILIEGKTVEEKFTEQEYSLLSLFLSNTNKLLSRDDIGEVLWGEQSYEKYSDWAIDQLISKLRKKLRTIGVKDKLVTVRGKGYKFIQSK